MRQSSGPAIPDNAAMSEDLLELGGGSFGLSRSQVGLSAYVHRIEAGDIVDERNLSQLDGGSSLQNIEGIGWFLFVESQLRVNRRQPERLHLSIKWEAFR